MINSIIIEDLPIALEGIKMLLSDVEGFNIVGEFKNGKEFTDNILDINTDIVLTDIDMPVMDGSATIRLSLS